MLFLRNLFDVYVKASFHVALMVLCFFEITHFQWNISTSLGDRLLVFSLTFLGYNAVKFYPFSKKIVTTLWLYHVLIPCGVLSLLVSVYLFFLLSIQAQLLLFACFLLCVAYAVPIHAKLGNLRSQYGLKIFIVAMCWTMLTAVYPLIDLVSWDPIHYLFFLERFILVFIATLPFEIRDAAKDQKELGTIPQLIGEHKTRGLGSVLLLLLLTLELGFPMGESAHSMAFVLMGLAYFIALFTVKKDSSENITLFWVELIPALGWLYYILKIF
ncbi:MAG: hypothetical protein ACPGC8_00655 [Flavobacteriaceae bacterium]